MPASETQRPPAVASAATGVCNNAVRSSWIFRGTVVHAEASLAVGELLIRRGGMTAQSLSPRQSALHGSPSLLLERHITLPCGRGKHEHLHFNSLQAIEAMVKLRFHPGKDVLARVAARAGVRSSRTRTQRTA